MVKEIIDFSEKGYLNVAIIGIGLTGTTLFLLYGWYQLTMNQ